MFFPSQTQDYASTRLALAEQFKVCSNALLKVGLTLYYRPDEVVYKFAVEHTNKLGELQPFMLLSNLDEIELLLNKLGLTAS